MRFSCCLYHYLEWRYARTSLDGLSDLRDLEEIKHPNFGRVILNEVKNLCVTGEILRSASSAQNDIGTIIFFRVP